MTDTRVPSRVFPRASQDAESAKTVVSTPQTENPAYRLAFQDMDFLLREDLRPVRFQLELLKAQLTLDEARIASTFVFYGSARIPEPAKAHALLEMASDDKSRRIAERLVEKSRYYDVARELAQITSRLPREGERDGVDYYYLTPDEFARRVKADEFLEWEEVYAGVSYGTLKSEITRIWDNGHVIIFDVDVNGGMNIKKYFGPDALAQRRGVGTPTPQPRHRDGGEHHQTAGTQRRRAEDGRPVRQDHRQRRPCARRRRDTMCNQ